MSLWEAWLPEEREAFIRSRLAADEKPSASKLAAEAGTTRNAVLGFAYRHKISFPSRPASKSPRHRKWDKRRNTGRRHAMTTIKTAPPPKTAKPAPPPEAPTVARTTMRDLRDGMCPFPMFPSAKGVPDPLALPYCGRKPGERSHRYCAGHETVVYQPRRSE